MHAVRVGPLPAFVPAERLLGPGWFTLLALPSGANEARGALPTAEATALAARLRGLGLDGHAIDVEIVPQPSRTAIREARLLDARARRDTTPGFTAKGVRLDEVGRYSLTPESLALALGARFRGKRVIDACAGAGGNAIGFARAGAEVTAIELDPARARDAEHNARVYGARMRVIVGDARTLVPTLSADVLFVDPPWGEGYDKRAVRLADLPLLEALLPLAERFETTVAKVPMSFDTQSFAGGRARAEAVFGTAPGDAHRVKFVLLTLTR